MDGASAWGKFRHITLPFLTPILVVTNMFGLIFNFFGFDILYMIRILYSFIQERHFF